MRHPSDDQLLRLARKINAEVDCTREEAEWMRHIADCTECYRTICCMMAMQDVADHIGELAGEVSPEDLRNPVQNKISAVIRLAVETVRTVLDQTDANDWVFRRAPLAIAGVRSGGTAPGGVTKKLADSGNSRTFVAYDPARKLLMIQIDGADCETEPRAVLVLPNGDRQDVRFEKQGQLYWAEVPDIRNGEYDLLLEK